MHPHHIGNPLHVYFCFFLVFIGLLALLERKKHLSVTLPVALQYWKVQCFQIHSAVFIIPVMHLVNRISYLFHYVSKNTPGAAALAKLSTAKGQVSSNRVQWCWSWSYNSALLNKLQMTSVSKCQQNGTYYCNCSVTNDFVNSIRKKQRKTLSERENSDINWDIVSLCMPMHYYSVLNWIGIWYIMIQEWILNLLPQCILNSSQTKTMIFLNTSRESWLQVFCSWTHLTSSFSSPLGGQYLLSTILGF